MFSYVNASFESFVCFAWSMCEARKHAHREDGLLERKDREHSWPRRWEYWEQGRRWRSGLRSFRGKTVSGLLDILSWDPVVLVSWGWRIGCDLQETRTFAGQWVLVSRSWEPAVMKRPASLRWSLLGSVSSESAHRCCVPDVAKTVAHAGSRTWSCVRVSQVVLVLKV